MNNELHKAARTGDLDTLKALIAQGEDINERGPHKWSLLITAAVGGHVETVGWLLDNGATTQSMDPADGKNALHWAAMSERLAVVEFLLERGFDPNAQDHYGEYAPIHVAAAKSRPSIAIPIITTLLKHGAKIDARNKCGQTALMNACFPGKTEVLHFLLDHGADINAAGYQGTTALMIAAWTSYTGIGLAEALLERGAEVDAVNAEGKTALLIAAAKENIPVVRLLLEHGAAIDHQDATGKTALIYASGPPPQASFLSLMIRTKESPPTRPRRQRRTSTLPAVVNKPKLTLDEQIARAWVARAEGVRLLRDRNADPFLRDNEGKTAMDWAREQEGGEAVVEVLRSAFM